MKLWRGILNLDGNSCIKLSDLRELGRKDLIISMGTIQSWLCKKFFELSKYETSVKSNETVKFCVISNVMCSLCYKNLKCHWHSENVFTRRWRCKI